MGRDARWHMIALMAFKHAIGDGVSGNIPFALRLTVSGLMIG